jgi:CheY-like chemotaxis protein
MTSADNSLECQRLREKTVARLTFWWLISCDRPVVSPFMSESNSPKGVKTYDLDKVTSWTGAKKILLLDDDFAFADLTRLLLEQNGYEVELAADGVQGIKKIMVEDYLAILCDMLMPNLAGDMFYIAVERVKPQLCQRFVFMTGLRGDNKIDEFIHKVKGVILLKPFQANVLFDAIDTVATKIGAA